MQLAFFLSVQEHEKNFKFSALLIKKFYPIDPRLFELFFLFFDLFQLLFVIFEALLDKPLLSFF